MEYKRFWNIFYAPPVFMMLHKREYLEKVGGFKVINTYYSILDK